MGIRYRLIVKGVGKVYDGDSGKEARRRFQPFVEKSKKRRSKVASRLITLFKNYQVIREYQVPDPEL
jgi:hypothetical protein